MTLKSGGNFPKNNKEIKKKTLKKCSLKNNHKYNVVFSTSTRQLLLKLQKVGFFGF